MVGWEGARYTSKSGCHPLNAGCSLPAVQNVRQPRPHKRTEGMLATSQRAPSAVKPVYAGSKAVWCMRPLRKGSGEGGQQLVRQLLSVEQRRAVQPLQWAPPLRPHPILLPHSSPNALGGAVGLENEPLHPCWQPQALQQLRCDVAAGGGDVHHKHWACGRRRHSTVALQSCAAYHQQPANRLSQQPSTACPASQQHTPLGTAPAIPAPAVGHSNKPTAAPFYPPFRAWRSSRSTPAPAAYASAIKCPGLSM